MAHLIKTHTHTQEANKKALFSSTRELLFRCKVETDLNQEITSVGVGEANFFDQVVYIYIYIFIIIYLIHSHIHTYIYIYTFFKKHIDSEGTTKMVGKCVSETMNDKSIWRFPNIS